MAELNTVSDLDQFLAKPLQKKPKPTGLAPVPPEPKQATSRVKSVSDLDQFLKTPLPAKAKPVSTQPKQPIGPQPAVRTVQDLDKFLKTPLDQSEGRKQYVAQYNAWLNENKAPAPKPPSGILGLMERMQQDWRNAGEELAAKLFDDPTTMAYKYRDELAHQSRDPNLSAADKAALEQRVRDTDQLIARGGPGLETSKAGEAARVAGRSLFMDLTDWYSPMMMALHGFGVVGEATGQLTGTAGKIARPVFMAANAAVGGKFSYDQVSQGIEQIRNGNAVEGWSNIGGGVSIGLMTAIGVMKAFPEMKEKQVQEETVNRLESLKRFLASHPGFQQSQYLREQFGHDIPLPPVLSIEAVDAAIAHINGLRGIRAEAGAARADETVAAAPEKRPSVEGPTHYDLPDVRTLSAEEREAKRYSLEDARKQLDEERQIHEQEQKVLEQEEAERQRIAKDRRETAEGEARYQAERAGKEPVVRERRALRFDTETADKNQQEHNRLTSQMDQVAEEHLYTDTEDMLRSIDTEKARGRELDPWKKEVLNVEARRREVLRLADPAVLEPKLTDTIAQAAKDMQLAEREQNMRDAAAKLEAEAKKKTTAAEFEHAQAEAEEAKKRAEEIRTQRDQKAAAAAAQSGDRQIYPVGAPIDMKMGAPTEIVLPSGKRLKAHYALAYGDQLITSHNPLTFEWNDDYQPREMQPRDYKTNREAQNGVITGGQHPEPDRVHSDDPSPHNGPPVILRDGRVVGGNGRAMRFLLAYRHGPGDLVFRHLRSKAGQFEIGDVHDLERKPMLVRVLDEDVERAEDLIALGRDLNRTETMGFDVAEQAVIAGRSLTDEMLEWGASELDNLGEDASLRDLMRARGPQIIEKMVNSGMIEPTKRASYILSDGSMSDAAKELFEDAWIGKIVDDADLLKSTPKDILRKLTRGIIGLVKAKVAGPMWDLSTDVKNALRLWKRVDSVRDDLLKFGKKDDSLVGRYLYPDQYENGSMLMDYGAGTAREQPHPTAEAIAKLLEKSQKEIKSAFSDYGNDAELGEARQHGLPGMPRSEAVESFNDTIGKEAGIKVKPEEWGREKAAEVLPKPATAPVAAEIPAVAAPPDLGTPKTMPEPPPAPVEPPSAVQGTNLAQLREFMVSHPGYGKLTEPILQAADILSRNALGMPLDEFLQKHVAGVTREKAGEGALSQNAAAVEAWLRKSKKISVKPYGEQLALIGEPEKTYLIVNEKGQSAMVLESEIAALEKVSRPLAQAMSFLRYEGKPVDLETGRMEAPPEPTGKQGGLFEEQFEEGTLFSDLDKGPKLLFQAARPTETPQFKKWFGDSKVKDAEGKPQLVFHGTRGDFPSFDAQRAGSMTQDESAKLGFFFSVAPGVADDFSGSFVDDTDWPPKVDFVTGANVIPAYLSIENPRPTMSAREWIGIVHNVREGEPGKIEKWKKLLQEAGFDGVHIAGDPKYIDSISPEYGHDQWVAFYPEQIKSSFNRGTFNRADPRMLFQPSGELTKGATEFLEDGKAIIHLFENADASTFLHEFFHTMRRYLKPEDQKVLEDWLKVKDGRWSRDHEEKAARGFEYYHRQREVKTLPGAVREVFQNIQNLMRQIYASLKGSPLVKPSKAVSELFDRWYGMEAPPEGGGLTIEDVGPIADPALADIRAKAEGRKKEVAEKHPVTSPGLTRDPFAAPPELAAEKRFAKPIIVFDKTPDKKLTDELTRVLNERPDLLTVSPNDPNRITIKGPDETWGQNGVILHLSKHGDQWAMIGDDEYGWGSTMSTGSIARAIKKVLKLAKEGPGVQDVQPPLTPPPEPPLETPKAEPTDFEKRFSKVVQVDPARLEHGAYDHKLEKEVGEGDISKAYSGDTIPSGKIRGVIAIEGKPYVTHGMAGGPGGRDAELTRLYTPEEWGDKPTMTYGEQTRRAASDDKYAFSYEGIKVKFRKQEYILGPRSEDILVKAKKEGGVEPPPEPEPSPVKAETIKPAADLEERPLSPEEREGQELVAEGGRKLMDTGAVRVKVFPDEAEAVAWAMKNKKKIKTMQLYKLKDGRHVADFVPTSEKLLFQETDAAARKREQDAIEKRLMSIIPEAERSRLAARLYDLKHRMTEPPPLATPTAGKVLKLWTPEGDVEVQEVQRGRTETEPVRAVPHGLAPVPEPPGTGSIPERPEPSRVPDTERGAGRTVRPAGRREEPRTVGGEPKPALPAVDKIRVAEPKRAAKPPIYSDADWAEKVKLYKLPDNAPTPTVAIPNELARMLMGGQRYIVESVLSGLDRHDAYILATTTGSGKTFMGSAVMRETMDNNPDAKILILTPSRTLIDGEGGWKQVGGDFGVEVQDLDNEHMPPQEPGAYTATWAGALNREGIEKYPWDLVIADEVQEARKWWSSQRGDMMKSIGGSSKKLIYMSATPFHTALEIGHMDKLNLWGREPFEQWAKQFGVYRDTDGNLAGGRAPLKLAKLRSQLIERGQMANLDRNMDGYSAHFGVVPMDGATVQGLNDIGKAMRIAENYFQQAGKMGKVRPTRAQAITLAKRWLEYQRLPQAVELGKKLEREGWKVIFFSENKKEFNELFEFLKEADEGTGGAISSLLPQFRSTTDVLQEAFGNDIAIFAGKQSGARDAEKDAFNSGDKKHLYATYGAGGVGVSLHDKTGVNPRAVIYLGPPWSGVSFDQALGRPWRYGTKSDVRAYFLFSNARSEMDLVANKVAPRMESLRAMVSGVKFLDPVVKALRDVPENKEAALDYDFGNEDNPNLDDFTKTGDTKMVTSYAEMPVVSAKDAHNKGMKIPGGEGATPPGVTRLFQDAPEDEIVPGDLEAPALQKARSVNIDIAEEFIRSGAAPGNRGGRDLTPIQRRAVADAVMAQADGAARDDPAAATQQVYTAWENAMTQIDAILSADKGDGGEGMESPPTLGGTGGPPNPPPREIGAAQAVNWYLFTNGRDVIRNATKAAGVPAIGEKMARDIASYHVLSGNIAGPWTQRYWDILKDNKISVVEHDVMALTLANREMHKPWIDRELARLRADTPMNPRIAKAVEEVDKLRREVFKRLQKDDVYLTVWDAASGAARRVHYTEMEEGQGYWARRYDYDAKHTVVDPDTGKEITFTLRELTKHEAPGEAKREAIVKGMMERHGLSRSEVEDWMSDRHRRVPLVGHIERAREADLPFFRTDPDVMISYFEGAGETLARKKIFGQEGEKVAGALAQIPNKKARDISRGILDSLLQRDPMENESRLWLRFAADWSVVSKMSFAAIKVLGHPAHGALMTNMRSFFGAMFEGVFDLRDARRLADMDGATLEQTKVEMLSEYGVDKKGIGSKFLKYNLWQAGYKWGRVVSDANARIYMERYALPELIKHPQDDRVRRQLHDFMLLDNTRIDAAIERGRWTDDDRHWAAKAFADKVMFTFDPTELPPLWRARAGADKPAQDFGLSVLRATTLLKGYQFKTTALLKDAIYDEIKNHGNFRPLLPFLLMYPILGQLITSMTALATGNAKHFKQLLDDKNWTPGQDLKRYIEDIAHQIGDSQLVAALEAFARGNFQLGEKIGAEYLAGPTLTDTYRSIVTVPEIAFAKTQRQRKKVAAKYIRDTLPVLQPPMNLIDLASPDANAGHGMVPPPSQ